MPKSFSFFINDFAANRTDIKELRFTVDVSNTGTYPAVFLFQYSGEIASPGVY